ncbi:hypothetical protein BCR39DRAFT_528627 [Naematelia encephala]|uniref:BTB domain-containing protein n=1 Tax=Naematelia encephala TaxID=71784 RepID=A0A1Y2B738_9TREE|nr:hypothetical protein BCR39DRAFT_528627 [Naematelia encephala]
MTSPNTSPLRPSSLPSSSRSALLTFQPSRNTPTPTLSSSQRRRNNHNPHLSSSLIPSTSRMSYHPPNYPGMPRVRHRDHSQISFEWHIHAASWLQDHLDLMDTNEWAVDGQDTVDELPLDIRSGWLIGDGWYKLDLARTVPSDLNSEQDAEINAHSDYLSLFIGARGHETNEIDYTSNSSIFVGITPLCTPVGSKYAETRWVWSTMVDEWEFSVDQNHWEGRLPRLATIMADSEILAKDGFSICVQIGTCASEKAEFGLPGMWTVPRNMIDGLSGLLDSTTGDVRFVCLEHDTTSDKLTSSRKRVLYAHSQILKARGDYFADLLSLGFSEATTTPNTSTAMVRTTITVDDASFTTVYWMLKFLYTNHLVFAPDDDVRVLMGQLQLDRGEIVKLLAGGGGGLRGGEWEYKRLNVEGEIGEDMSELEMRDDFDARTVLSVSSVGTSASRRVSAVVSPTPAIPPTTNRRDSPNRARAGSASGASSTLSKTSRTSRTSSSATPTTSTSRSRLTPSTNPTSPSRSSSSIPKTTPTSTGSTSPKHLPLGRPQRHVPEPDPHPHPAPPPPPGSALAVYMLANRYRLDTLEALAKEHILAKMTGDNCMPMLFASYRYDTLHSDTLDFVVEHWPEVQGNPEFLRCIQEVSAGVWGETGGLVLHGLFQRL